MKDWPDTEEVLTRFRDWLDQTRSDCAALDTDSPDDDPPAEPVGLHQLVEQFTALRHDVKLLTRASRGADERHEATLLSLQAAIEQFRTVKANEEAAAEKAARPVVAALVDLDEALVRGRDVIDQARQRVLQDIHGELKEVRDRLDKMYRTQPWWRRLLCRPWHRAVREIYSGGTVDAHRSVFDSLLEGYDLILARLRRTMKEQSIVRMRCVGEPADPNCMTVIETVGDPCRRPGTVVEEVRPGYCWAGRVLRFAEVKAVGER